MRVVEKKEARGSLRWIRIAANDAATVFNRHIYEASNIPFDDEIIWVSPLKNDEYAEYRDQDFLDLIDLELPKLPLNTFWPKLGPQWDGLGRTENGRILLVEAKANIPEVVSPGTGASSESRALIDRSVGETKAFLGVDKDIPWTGKLYQYANRLAHLYLLRELNDIDAYLVFVYFVGDDEVNGPKSIAEWKSALSVVKKVLGLGSRHALSKYVVDVYIDIAEIEK